MALIFCCCFQLFSEKYMIRPRHYSAFIPTEFRGRIFLAKPLRHLMPWWLAQLVYSNRKKPDRKRFVFVEGYTSESTSFVSDLITKVIAWFRHSSTWQAEASWRLASAVRLVAFSWLWISGTDGARLSYAIHTVKMRNKITSSPMATWPLKFFIMKECCATVFVHLHAWFKFLRASGGTWKRPTSSAMNKLFIRYPDKPVSNTAT